LRTASAAFIKGWAKQINAFVQALPSSSTNMGKRNLYINLIIGGCYVYNP